MAQGCHHAHGTLPTVGTYSRAANLPSGTSPLAMPTPPTHAPAHRVEGAVRGIRENLSVGHPSLLARSALEKG